MTRRQPSRHAPHAPQARRERLKRRAARLAGGDLVAWESNELSPDGRERFWRHVIEMETARMTTDFERLSDAGVALPEPDAVDDAALSSTLWRVIRALAAIRVFITQTDHLSDRELYEWLWREGLRQEIPAAPDAGSVSHVDVLGAWSQRDTTLFLKYYADEEDRRAWLAEFPDLDLPAHEAPPFDRDRYLPGVNTPGSATPGDRWPC